MATIQGPLNLGYGAFELSTGISDKTPIKEESITITFDKVATGQTKSPYFNILQGLLGTNGVNGAGTQVNVYIGIHEPGSVFDSTVYTNGVVDMAVWDTSLMATLKNGSTLGDWYDGGANQRILNPNIHLHDGVQYTVGMKIVGDAVVGYFEDEAGVQTEIGSFSGLTSQFQGFKNRIITELEFTSQMDSSQEPLVASTFSNVRFNGIDNARLFAVSDADAGVGTVAGAQVIKSGSATDLTFTAVAGANLHHVNAKDTTITYSGKLNSYELIRQANGDTLVTTPGHTEVVSNADRFYFADNKAVAFDTDGNAGRAYRLYKAAFDREPDLPGLGFWIDKLDHGMSLNQAAQGFVGSMEFQGLYGTAPTNGFFITKLYNNVLDRDPEEAGFNHWMSQMQEHHLSGSDLLVSFSESRENQLNLIGQIEHGMTYDVFLG